MTRWAHAQVVSAQDSIQTQVVHHNNQFDIFGGTAADHAKLLFHSFDQFDLASGSTARFHVAPGVQTVFSRIINGAPSHINGLLEMSGSPASLYLMNPAGVLFGNEALVNLTGDFTVVTAEQLNFTQGHFGLVGDPQDVQGTILQLHFNADNPATIVNLGELAVGSEHSLSLIGHRVLNQGTLSGGAINLVAVGNYQNVSLADGFQFESASQETIQTLPPWLTPAGTEHATRLTVNADGSLHLTGAQLSDMSLSDMPAGIAIVGGTLTTTGTPNRIQIFGDHIATAGAKLRTNGDGQILIGGDYRGSGSLPTAQSVFIDSMSTIRADGNAGDNSNNQTGGQVVIWSEHITQFRGEISAQGLAAGGTVEISGKDQLHFNGRVDLRSQGIPGTLLLDPENIEIRAGSDPGSADTSEPQIIYEDTLENSIIGNTHLVFQANNNITIHSLRDGILSFPQGTGSISFIADADGDGKGRFAMASDHRLEAPGQDISITAADITVSDIDTSIFSAINNVGSAGDIRLTATQGNIISHNLTSTARGTLNNTGSGGEVFLSASNSITVGDVKTTASALNNRGSAGRIMLNAQTGTVTTDTLNTSVSANNNAGIGGSINLSASGSIVTGDVLTAVSTTGNNVGNAGNVSLTSLTDDITTASIAADTIAARSNTGNGGTIDLNAPQGAITSQQITATTVSSELAQTQGGNIELNANNTIVVDFIDATGQSDGGNINIITQQAFRAIDTIPTMESPISLLTTGNGTIRVAYNRVPSLPFSIGDSSKNGTAGRITAGADTLPMPQTVPQSLNVGNIIVNNLFEDLPDVPSVELPSKFLSEDLSSISTNSTALSNLERFINIFNANNNQITRNSHDEGDVTLNSGELIWAQIEMAFSSDFAKALSLPLPASPSLQTVQAVLRRINHAQTINPALMYIRLQDTHIELVLVSSEGPPVYYPVTVPATEIYPVIDNFHQTITNPVLRSNQYLPAAQQLYDWLVRPMLTELKRANIDHLGFVLDAGLRSLPMAALHDGERFLIEHYSLGLLPSIGLTSLESRLPLRSEIQWLEQETTLAMGIANFDEQVNLAAVPLELELASQHRNDEHYLDHEATVAVLQKRLEQGQFTNVHLATHAVFQPGSLETSYVQLWDRNLYLNQLQELPLDTIDFLILSACATALGDPSAEFGFAGLAVKVGVQTALASLWSISDEGTLGLMSEFYRALEQPLTRSAALRQAQLAMLQGQVGMMDGTVYDGGGGSEERIVGYLPSLDGNGSWDFSHPAYWSGFTMIGNPW